MMNPATREFHILDGSAIWLRVLDTLARDVAFAVVGTGRHRSPVADAVNNWGGLPIWHHLGVLQGQLYSGVPAAAADVPQHIADAIARSAPRCPEALPNAQLARQLRDRSGDASGPGEHPYENGDGYA